MLLKHYGQVSFGVTIGPNEGWECELLIVNSKDDITFTFVGNRSAICSFNSDVAWKQFSFVFMVKAIVTVKRISHIC